MIDLVGVACEDDLGVFTCTGDDGLDFVGREVLGFIDDHVLSWDGASADVGQSFDVQGAHIDEFLIGAPVAFVFLVESHQEFDVIEDGLHPGAEFFVEATRQEAKIAAHGEDRTADQEALVEFLVHGVVEARSDGE